MAPARLPPPPPRAVQAKLDAHKVDEQCCHYDPANFVGEEGCCQPDCMTWSRKHWCIYVLTILAAIGILVPLIMFLLPCETTQKITESLQPVDLYIVLDASGSVGGPGRGTNWETEKSAAYNLLSAFQEFTNETTLRAGVGVFSTIGTNYANLTTDIDSVLTKIKEDLVYDDSDTNYIYALQTFLFNMHFYGSDQGELLYFADRNSECTSTSGITNGCLSEVMTVRPGVSTADACRQTCCSNPFCGEWKFNDTSEGGDICYTMCAPGMPRNDRSPFPNAPQIPHLPFCHFGLPYADGCDNTADTYTDGGTVSARHQNFNDITPETGCITYQNTVTSGNFPFKEYPQNQQCEWEILKSGTLIVDVKQGGTLKLGSRVIEAGSFSVNRGDRLTFDGFQRVTHTEGSRTTTTELIGNSGFMAHMSYDYGNNGRTKGIMIFISDGEPRDSLENRITEPVRFGNYLGNEYMNLSMRMHADYDIVGIMVNADRSLDFNLCQVSDCFTTTGCNRVAGDNSTCEGVDPSICAGEENCPYFKNEPNFNDFVAESTELAQRIISTVPRTQTIEESCDKAPWLGFLALLIPFVLLCLTGCMCSRKKTMVQRKETKVLKKAVSAPAMRAPPPQPTPLPKPNAPPSGGNVPAKAGGKKYKWDIAAADQYMWARDGGAVGPMKVNFAGKAPPSAPKDLTTKKMVVVEEWEGEDGYDYEYVEVENTFEGVVEEYAEEIVKIPIFRLLCCCCLWQKLCFCCKPFCCDCCCIEDQIGEKRISTSSRSSIELSTRPQQPQYKRVEKKITHAVNVQGSPPPQFNGRPASAPPMRANKISVGLSRAPAPPPAPPQKMFQSKAPPPRPPPHYKIDDKWKRMPNTNSYDSGTKQNQPFGRHSLKKTGSSLLE